VTRRVVLASMELIKLPGEISDFASIHREEGLLAVPLVASYPIHSVEIKLLIMAGSPRLAGEDPVHTRALAEVADLLPPIVVHQPTMHVIDGMHRIRAALLNNRTFIRASMIDCDEALAFVLAVKANVTHGLPLSSFDRKAAARSIIASHPDWSDRAVADATGLSDKTVSAVRAGSTSDTPQSNDRMGRDGRVRPLNSAVQREMAALMIVSHPEAGLREIARATGLSPATVRDVRIRTERGEDPVPVKYRVTGSRILARRFRPAPSGVVPVRRPALIVDNRALLSKLVSDPSLRFSDSGKLTLQWLHQYTVDTDSCQGVGTGIPDHWAGPIAALARSCSAAWLVLADQLDKRHLRS